MLRDVLPCFCRGNEAPRTGRLAPTLLSMGGLPAQGPVPSHPGHPASQGPVCSPKAGCISSTPGTPEAEQEHWTDLQNPQAGTWAWRSGCFWFFWVLNPCPGRWSLLVPGWAQRKGHGRGWLWAACIRAPPCQAPKTLISGGGQPSAWVHPWLWSHVMVYWEPSPAICSQRGELHSGSTLGSLWEPSMVQPLRSPPSE